MTHNDHPRLFFLHLPKCAGMTLHGIIEQQYAPEAIYTVPSVAWNDQNYRALCEEWCPEKKMQLRVVKGHMGYGWHHAFGDDAHEYITILRHPLQRVLSLFRFAGPWHTDYAWKCAGLAAFVRHAEEAHNDMTYWLSGRIGRNRHAFVRAWCVLVRKIAVVGTVETFDNTVARLAARYGWRTEPYERRNVTTHRPCEISSSLTRAILHRNTYDLMLYAYATRHYEHQL